MLLSGTEISVSSQVKHKDHMVYHPADHGRTPESIHAAKVLCDPWFEWTIGKEEHQGTTGVARL